MENSEKESEKKSNGLHHERSILEQLLMSFRVKDARKKSIEITSSSKDIKDIYNFDLNQYGEEKEKISFAINSYVRAIEYINEHYY